MDTIIILLVLGVNTVIDHAPLLLSSISIDALLPYGTVGFALAYAVTINDLSQRLEVLVTECNSGNGTSNMRTERNTLLKWAVKLCLTSIRIWAYGKYDKGEMTAEDVHSLGFLLLGENGGRRNVAEPTHAIAEVKKTQSGAIHYIYIYV
jgi:hypothetical protein